MRYKKRYRNFVNEYEYKQMFFQRCLGGTWLQSFVKVLSFLLLFVSFLLAKPKDNGFIFSEN